MRNKHLKKLAVCLILSSTTACATLNQSPTSDSFCSTYQPLIRAVGEGVISAKRPVKERIYANEKTYRQFCGAPK